ncbi:hypothetical protein V9T40_007725 [Parthenolecanium corni]|uniref:Uncharacterized protein n=1 Tax=Parthenolecanium corni TaxID=536013 RepID=A0AAN9Y645_9HEMI
MPTASSNDGKPLSVSDFTSMYNKWLKELVNIENTLMKKAEDTQALQSTLNEDADTLKGISEKLLPLQIEQNYLEDHLQSLLKEQDELEQEINKLNDMEDLLVDSNVEDNDDDYPAIFETIESELTTVKGQIKEMVDKINTKMNKYENNNNPVMVYRTIMDRYTDALQTLETSTVDLHQKLDELFITE